MSHIRYDDEPPEVPKNAGTLVFSVPKAGRCFVRILGRITGVWVHWIDNRSRPCFREDCPYCPAPRRWKGYAPAKLWKMDPETGKFHWVNIVIELTDTVCSIIGKMDYVGLVLELSRTGNHRASALKVKVCEKQVDEAAGEPFAVRPILQRLWGIQDEMPEQSIPNPGSQILPYRKQA